MIETPSLLSPCGSYQVDFFPIKGRSDLFLRCGVFEGLIEFQECVSHVEMFREVESKRFKLSYNPKAQFIFGKLRA